MHDFFICRHAKRNPLCLGATALVAYPAMKLLIYFDQEEKKEMEEKAYEAEHVV